MYRLSMSRQCAGKLPAYRTERTRYGGCVGASRISPLSRLAAAAPDLRRHDWRGFLR